MGRGRKRGERVGVMVVRLRRRGGRAAGEGGKSQLMLRSKEKVVSDGG